MLSALLAVVAGVTLAQHQEAVVATAPRIIEVSGAIALKTSPPAGTVFLGTGAGCVVRVSRDDLVIENVSFVNCGLADDEHTQGTRIAYNNFLGALREQGCNKAGGQSLMLANHRGARRKIVEGNYFRGFACQAISIYNHGPVNGIVIRGNETVAEVGPSGTQQDNGCTPYLSGPAHPASCASGDVAWSIYGPREAFHDLHVTGNRFGTRARIGHAGFSPFPYGTASSITSNVFLGPVTVDLPVAATSRFHERMGVAICGNQLLWDPQQDRYGRAYYFHPYWDRIAEKDAPDFDRRVVIGSSPTGTWFRTPKRYQYVLDHTSGELWLYAGYQYLVAEQAPYTISTQLDQPEPMPGRGRSGSRTLVRR